MLAYLLDLGDFAGECAVGNIDDGSDLDGLWQGSVGAGNARVVSFHSVISHDLELLSGGQLDRLVIYEQTRADLGTLRIEHDSARLVRSLLQRLAQVGHRLTMGLKQAYLVRHDTLGFDLDLRYGLRVRSSDERRSCQRRAS